ncbi:MAG: CRTAC1 family protein [Rhodothermales bacterium]
MGGLLLVTMLVAACGSPDSSAPPASPDDSRPTSATPRFSDITEEAGLGGFRHETGAVGDKWFPESMGSGCAFIDYNGDGRPDILLAGGGSWSATDRPTLSLYRNDGGGTFKDVTAEVGLGQVDAYTLGFAVADYDNDGDQDFYVTTLSENILFRNNSGIFAPVDAGVAGDPVWSSSALFFDANGDGAVDFYVGNYVRWSPETDIFCSLDGIRKDYCTPEAYDGVPGRFYVNNGDGTFRDATEDAGFVPAPGKALGVVELDYNRDGAPDLAVASDTEPDLLYENNGDGTFTERGTIAGIAYDENGAARAGMGIDAGVVDSTGEVSLFVGNFSKETIGVYRHARVGLFEDRAFVSKIGRPSLMTLTFGLFLFDVDLDGDLDLFAANGHVQPDIETVDESVRYAEAPHLFVNQGDGSFVDAAPKIGGVLSERIVARGSAHADIDGDGDLDVLVTENGGRVHLWRNELNDSGRDLEPSTGFLRVTLEGTRSNRSGLSARIVAVSEGRWMERRVRSGSTYLSASELPVTFGLGSASSVDSLAVEWPSGRIDHFTHVSGNRHVRLVEGSDSIHYVD